MSTSLASATTGSTNNNNTDSTKMEDMKSTTKSVVSTFAKQSSDDSPRRSSRPTVKPNYSITEIFDDVHFGQVESATPMTMMTTTTPTAPRPAILSDKVMLQSSPKREKQLPPTTRTLPLQLAGGPSEETPLLRRKKTIFPAILPANSTNSRTIRLTVASQPVATLLPQPQRPHQPQQAKERKERKEKKRKSSIDIIPMILPSPDLTISTAAPPTPTTATITPTTSTATTTTKTRKRREKNIKLNIKEMDPNEAKVDDASVFDGISFVEKEKEDDKLQSDSERPKRKRRRKKSIGDRMKDALFITEQMEQNDETTTTTTNSCPPVKERRIVFEGKCQHCSLGTSVREDTPLKEQRNPLICCDLCSLLFHIDCLPTPTIAAPSPGTPFTCPMHLDRYNLQQIYGSDADADAKIAIIQEKLSIPYCGSGSDMVSVAKIGIESWPDENLFIWPESAIRCQMSWKVRGHRVLVEDSGFGFGGGGGGGENVKNGNENGDIISNDSMEAADADVISTTFTPPSSVFEHYKYIRGLSRRDVERIKYSETMRYRDQGCETGI